MQSQNATSVPAWQAPIHAFFNKRFYVQVAENWSGAGIAYTLLVTLFFATISFVPLLIACYQTSHNQQLVSVLAEVPTLTYNNGQVTIDKPSPYQVKDPKSGTVFAEFRMENGVPVVKDSDPPFVITKDALVMNGAGANGANYVSNFADWQGKLPNNTSFTGNDMLRLFQMTLLWMPIVIFVLTIPCVLVAVLLLLATYGAIEMLICNGMNRETTFAEGMRVAAIALTPSIVLNALLAAGGIGIPVVGFLPVPINNSPNYIIGWIAMIVITIGYLVFAALALKSSRQASIATGAPPAA